MLKIIFTKYLIGSLTSKRDERAKRELSGNDFEA